jgi:putative two-component system response regulator
MTNGVSIPSDSYDEVASVLLRIAAILRAELASPSEDSVIRVAAAHNELRSIGRDIARQALADCLLDVAQFFNVSGHTALGLEPAARAVEIARSLSDGALLRKALTFHGILLADSGNLPSAIEAYSAALDIAVDLEDPYVEGVVWNNLGTAFLYSAQYVDAINCFKRCLTLASRDVRLVPVSAKASSNVALCCLFAEQYEAGISAVEAAIGQVGLPASANDFLSRVNSESNYCRLLLEVGRIDDAVLRSDLAKRFAMASHLQRAEHVAAIAEGLCDVYAGKTDIGLTRLQSALQQARVMKFSLRDALVAMVKAHDRAGNSQLALVHLRELLNVTRRTQQERALAHHRMHLAAVRVKSSPDALEALIDSRRRGVDRDEVRTELALLVRQSIAAELIEDPSGEHIFRVGKLSALLGAEVGLDDDTCFMLEMSARLHDIGKIGIPEAIIAKRGRINPDQRALVQTHASIGSELLSQSGLPHIQMAVDVARHHHEKWDGSGYPDGLAMEAIPEVARIVALADSFDAMTHDRPYRPALSFERALAEIAAAAGTKFDPGMTEAFIALVRRLRAEHADLDGYLGADAQESPFIRARKKISAALQQAKQSGGLAGL